MEPITKGSMLFAAQSALESSRVLSSMPVDVGEQPSFYGQILFNFTCLELIVKVFWMMENEGSVPEDTHNIKKVFDSLKEETRKHIKHVFNTDPIRKQHEELFKNRIPGFQGENLDSILNGSESVQNHLKYTGKIEQPILAGQHLNFLETLIRELGSKVGGRIPSYQPKEVVNIPEKVKDTSFVNDKSREN